MELECVMHSSVFVYYSFETKFMYVSLRRQKCEMLTWKYSDILWCIPLYLNFPALRLFLSTSQKCNVWFVLINFQHIFNNYLLVSKWPLWGFESLTEGCQQFCPCVYSLFFCNIIFKNYNTHKLSLIDTLFAQEQAFRWIAQLVKFSVNI